MLQIDALHDEYDENTKLTNEIILFINYWREMSVECDKFKNNYRRH
jgi:hypothetical protein